jgi:hypothetical protein
MKAILPLHVSSDSRTRTLLELGQELFETVLIVHAQAEAARARSRETRARAQRARATNARTLVRVRTALTAPAVVGEA